MEASSSNGAVVVYQIQTEKERLFIFALKIRAVFPDFIRGEGSPPLTRGANFRGRLPGKFFLPSILLMTPTKRQLKVTPGICTVVWIA